MKPIKNGLLCLTGIFLLALPLQALPLSDNAGLTMDVGSTGVVSGVGLNGTSPPSGTGGGFFLREPNSSTRVPMTGSAVSTNGVLALDLASTALNASVTADVIEGNGYIEVSGTLENLDVINNPDRGLWLGFNLPVNTMGWKWGQSLSINPVISAAAPAYTSNYNYSVPIPAVWTNNGGIAMSIPPTHPCVFEVGANANGLSVQMAFGLSPATAKFPSQASFRFRIYSIDGTWGFRDALAKYYDWYPDYYTIAPWVMTQLDHHHDWINMNFVSDSFNTDDQVDPNAREYQAYTKTSARIQNIPDVESITTTQGYLDAIANTNTIQHYEKTAPLNHPLLVEGREALINSICYQPDGTYDIFSQAAESPNGTGTIDFPHNCDPDLFKDAAHPNSPVFADMYLRKAVDLRAASPDFASIHWDRLGGWSNFLNHRREHFAYADYPLTFDQQGRVCIQTQFSNYELFDAYRLLINQGGLFHEAAGMKDFGLDQNKNGWPGGQSRVGMFFLASLVAGGWQEGSFKPIELGGLDVERMSVGRKSYRISSGNIIARSEAPTLELVKGALAKTTAYGFACPVQVQYFYPPNHPGYLPDYSWYTLPDHKALWDKYEPANLAIRLAGWEPVTHAYSSSSEVQLQRFGRGQELYLTAWGPNPPASVEIEVDAAALGMSAIATFSEMISDISMTVVPSAKGWKLTVPMETNITRVIKITSSSALTATFTESSVWTCPAGVTSVTAECWGGGGAGGAAFRNATSGSNSTGGGGAGGAHAKKVISGLIPGTNYTVTVGAGGVSVAGADDGTSTPGGDSWFATAATVLAKGGAGGIARNGVGLVGAGGVGSTEGSIGDVLHAGGSGSSGNGAASGGGGGGSGGTGLAGITATGSTGAAAVTDGGLGGNGATTNADGSAPASGPGGGGGGARGPNAAKAGGAGSPGQVILTYDAGSPVPPTYSEWSIQYNLVQGPEGDDDGDGHSNQFEFVAGLVPTDAASVFKTTAAPVPGQLNRVSIEISPILSGRTYTVKSSDSLASGSWTALVDPIVSNEGDVRTVVDTAATGEKKFYVIEINIP